MLTLHGACCPARSSFGTPDLTCTTSDLPRWSTMRRYLKRSEFELLVINATKSGRYGARDALMLRLMYGHGLRVGELCGLLWSDIDLTDATILCRRKKSGVESLHPLSPREHSQLLELHAASHG